MSNSAANQLWFLDALVTIRVSLSEGQDGISVIEHRVPYGSSAPLHRHLNEDEVFHIIEGEVRIRLGDRETRLGAGQTLLAPKGVPHTYRVESAGGAVGLTITTRGDFERFVRAMGRPAESAGLPGRAALSSPGFVAELTATAAAHGIQIVGPPLE